MSDSIEPAVLKAYVDMQNQTPCRKCKAKEWTLTPERKTARGGDRVGIFVVLGKKEDTVATIAFSCDKCGALFERPAYSRDQLARQQFPAVQLDIRLDTPAPDRNGGQ